jgi:hypothetical protein
MKFSRNCDFFLSNRAKLWHFCGQLQKEFTMLKTITLGRHISIQGVFVRRLPGGMVVVRVGQTLHAGWPVQGRATSAA